MTKSARIAVFKFIPSREAVRLTISLQNRAPWDKVYESDNYRPACSLLNARKKDFADVLDLFDILELVGFQILLNPALGRVRRKRVLKTIERLRLDDFRRDRVRDAERYWAKDISLTTLREESPFVAKELHRQGRLNTEDA